MHVQEPISRLPHCQRHEAGDPRNEDDATGATRNPLQQKVELGPIVDQDTGNAEVQARLRHALNEGRVSVGIPSPRDCEAIRWTLSLQLCHGDCHCAPRPCSLALRQGSFRQRPLVQRHRSLCRRDCHRASLLRSFRLGLFVRTSPASRLRSFQLPRGCEAFIRTSTASRLRESQRGVRPQDDLLTSPDRCLLTSPDRCGRCGLDCGARPRFRLRFRQRIP